MDWKYILLVCQSDHVDMCIAQLFRYNIVVFHKRLGKRWLSYYISSMVSPNGLIVLQWIYGILLFSGRRFPFDRRTFPIGYLLSFSFEMVLLFYDCIAAAFFPQFMLGCAFMLMAFIEDIQQDLKSLNESAKNGVNPLQFQKRFNTVIQLHSNAKELSKNSIESDSGIHWHLYNRTICVICFKIFLELPIFCRISMNSSWLVSFYGVYSQYVAHSWWFKLHWLSIKFAKN